jgi:hypothetical protein
LNLALQNLGIRLSFEVQIFKYRNIFPEKSTNIEILLKEKNYLITEKKNWVKILDEVTIEMLSL